MLMKTFYTTGRAAALAAQMGKHFSHKITIEEEGDNRALWFEGARARLEPQQDGLAIGIEGDSSEQVQRIAGVVESHLLRFAFREEPAPLVWSDPA